MSAVYRHKTSAHPSNCCLERNCLTDRVTKTVRFQLFRTWPAKSCQVVPRFSPILEISVFGHSYADSRIRDINKINGIEKLIQSFHSMCKRESLPASPDYSWSDSTKSLALGIATVSKPYSCHKWGDCAKLWARGSVCSCSRSGECACIPAVCRARHVGRQNARSLPGYQMICAAYPM